MTRLRILFDADDVAEDLIGNWVLAVNEKYGTAVTPEDVRDWDITKAFPTLTREQIFSVLDENELWENLEAIPGSQSYLQRLFDDGHELYMVTATDYRTCEAKIERMLKLFPFLDSKHIIIAHNKQMICGDVLIDDAPHNLVGGQYFPILFDRPHNRGFDESKYKIHRVTTWEEIYQLIQGKLVKVESST